MRFDLMLTAAVAMTLVALPARAADAPAGADPMSAIYACASIADSTERLACYDREVGAVKSKQDEGAFTAIDSKRAEVIKREAFGFTIPSLPRLKLPGGAEPENEQTMIIKSVRSEGSRPVFVMDNGQVWRQIDTDSNRNARPGAQVRIKRAALGSFLMSPKAGGTGLRVRREE